MDDDGAVAEFPVSRAGGVAQLVKRLPTKHAQSPAGSSALTRNVGTQL